MVCCRKLGPICSVEGCPTEAICCHFEDGMFFEHLCREHAQEAGFCPGCGLFCGGQNSFETHDWCEMCLADIEDNSANLNEDEFYDWYEDEL